MMMIIFSLIFTDLLVKGVHGSKELKASLGISDTQMTVPHLEPDDLSKRISLKRSSVTKIQVKSDFRYLAPWIENHLFLQSGFFYEYKSMHIFWNW